MTKPKKKSKATKKVKKQYLDFNGAFVFYPKGMKSHWNTPTEIRHGFLVYNATIKEAIKELSGDRYKKFLSKFKKDNQNF